MKSCLFAGHGELPHAGSRAVVFSRRPDRRAPAKWQPLCTAFVPATQRRPYIARACVAAAGQIGCLWGNSPRGRCPVGESRGEMPVRDRAHIRTCLSESSCPASFADQPYIAGRW